MVERCNNMLVDTGIDPHDVIVAHDQLAPRSDRACQARSDHPAHTAQHAALRTGEA
jgi:hypothetical protein